MAGSHNGDGGEDGEGGGWLQNGDNGGWLQNGDGQKIILVSLKVGHFCRHVWIIRSSFQEKSRKVISEDQIIISSCRRFKRPFWSWERNRSN